MENGLEKLLTILQEPPLQKLPMPDSFNRLEKWCGLCRGQGESIPQLLMREEELVTELQQSLKRARQERKKAEMKSTASGVRERHLSESLSRSPAMGAGLDDMDDGEDQPPHAGTSMESGFFENELRGYRLLKTSKLSTSEKQHVLTLTKNLTHFMLLFAETDIADEMKQQKRAVWCTEAPEDWDGYGEEWVASNGGIPRPTGLSGRPSLWKMVRRRTIEERRLEGAYALATEAK